MAQEIVSTLRPKWRLKMFLYIAVSLGFGIWGYYDATVAYPRRGERHAEFLEQRYLAALQASSTAALAPTRASIPDPQARLDSIEAQRQRAQTLTGLDQTTLNWLRALATVGKLTPEHTTFDDPAARLDELTNVWATRDPPKPLHWYDIAVQWIIFVVFTAVAVMIAMWVLIVARRRSRWEPATQTLTLPTGEKITPDDLVDVDKRKWDRFFVFLKIRDDHPTLPGRELRVDLYRHAGIEDWILQMERTRFPDRAQDHAADQQPQSEPEARAEPDTPGV